MKTAIQQAIRDLKEDKNNSNYAMEKNAIQDCIIILNSYLEKEKKQIVDAYDYGFHDAMHQETKSDYYEDKFHDK